MTDDENRDESEDELRRRAEESFNTGVGAYKHGDLQGALERYGQALALFRGVSGSERNQANCLNNSGNALRELGDLRGALERYKRALSLLDRHTPEADRIEAGRTGARCVLGIGACLINLDEAVFPDHFTRALEVFRRPEHVDHTKADQASCLTSIGGMSICNRRSQRRSGRLSAGAGSPQRGGTPRKGDEDQRSPRPSTQTQSRRNRLNLRTLRPAGGVPQSHNRGGTVPGQSAVPP